MDSKFNEMKKFILIVLIALSHMNAISQDNKRLYVDFLESYFFSGENRVHVDTFMLTGALICDFNIVAFEKTNYENSIALRDVLLKGEFGESKVFRFTENGNLRYIFSESEFGAIRKYNIAYYDSGKMEYWSIMDQYFDEMYLSYHENGCIECVTRTKNGRMSGDRYCYRDTGQLSTITTYYANDSYHIRTYSESAKLLKEADYNSRGDLHGEVKYYNKRGKVKRIEQYKEGVIVSKGK